MEVASLRMSYQAATLYVGLQCDLKGSSRRSCTAPTSTPMKCMAAGSSWVVWSCSAGCPAGQPWLQTLHVAGSCKTVGGPAWWPAATGPGSQGFTSSDP